MKKLRVEEAYVRIILHGFHSHSWCHSISNYYPSPISSSAASDMLKIIYLLHHWGQWRERYEWTFREINNKKKKNRHSQYLQIKTAGCFLHYYISNTEWNALQWKKKKWINILSYLTWVFFSFYLFLHAGFISTLKSIYQTFRSGRLAINSLRGGMWKNKNLSKI